MLSAFVASAAAVVPIAILLSFFLIGSVNIEYIIVAFVLVLVLAFIPGVLVIAVAEWKRIRGWLYFAVAGGLTAILLLALLGVPAFRSDSDSIYASAFLLVGGLVAGFVYWLIAGKTSGALRDAWAARGVAQ